MTVLIDGTASRLADVAQAVLPNAAKRHMSSDAERRRRETTALDKSRPVV
jgi:hypothetical protein